MKNQFLGKTKLFIKNYENNFILYLATSVIFMFLILIFLNWLCDHNIKIYNIAVFYGAVVAYATLVGGIKAGITNTILGTIFSYLHFVRIIVPSERVKTILLKPNMNRSLLNISVSFISLLAICMVVYIIKNRLNKESQDLKKAKDELFESREIFKTILNSAGEGILAINNSNQITLSNNKFKEMFDIPNEIMNTNDFLKVLDYFGEQYINSNFNINKIIDFNKTAAETSFEVPYNNRKIYEIYTCPLVKSGEIKGRVTCYKDITEKRKVENEHKEHLKFLETLMNTIPNPIYYKDSQKKYLGCNEAFGNLVGMPVCEIIGKTSFEVLDFNIAKEHGDKDSKILNSSQVQVYESEFTARDGKSRSLVFNKVNFTNNEGDVEGIVGTITDLTDIKKLESELLQSHERYKNLVELLPEAIVVHREGIIKYINKAALKLSGNNELDCDFFIGKHIFDFIAEEFKPLVKQRVADIKNEAIKNTKESLPWTEQRVIKLDGSLIDLEVTSVPFPDEEKNAVMVVAKDITERKKAEALEKSLYEEKKLFEELVAYDKVKTEFFANISHELRTPLNVILGSIQLINYNMEEDFILGNGSGMKKYMNPMKQNCFRLLRIVNNLIDITKIDAGYFELNLKNYNIVSVIEEITMSVVDYVEGRGVSLIFDTDVEEKILACDVDKIERIMLNLLSNSIKFTQKGDGIEVRITDLGEKISISVIDTGIGIPEDKLNSIFERFIQVDKSLTRNNEGSGIGLSLVKSLVEMHGGEVSVKSELGKGSNFTFKIPVKLVDDSCKIHLLTDNLNQDVVERINVEFSDIYSM